LQQLCTHDPAAGDDEVGIGEIVNLNAADPRSISVVVLGKREFVAEWRRLVFLARQPIPTKWPNLQRSYALWFSYLNVLCHFCLPMLTDYNIS
jgi:hypothetical protein